MPHRRTFLSAAVGAGLAAARADEAPRKKLAVVTTVWRERSHAWHMAERFLAGYPVNGRWHKPPIDVVSAYVDQYPKSDLSRQRAKESGFTLYPTIAEALRNGKDKLAVDGVLIIGEHGNYDTSDIGQTKYPRYEFFSRVVEVFRKDGRSVPVFNDKHLSWNREWAAEMVQTARKIGFPFLAGSSLPVTFRMPSIDLPYGEAVEEMMCVAIGRVDSYDFHALEVIQCMAERRKGGETGVKAVQGLRGDAVWKAMEDKAWDARLFEACLCRSQTLAQRPTYSHRFPSLKEMREWVKAPVAYRIEYADGLKATMLLMNGLVGDFTFAARLAGKKEPLSTLFYLPPVPNVVYSAALMSKAEEMFLTGKAPYPIERTLLTTGLVEAGVRSLAQGQKRLETPHLAIRYRGPKESQFAKE
jgi:hypothetical protein